MSRSADGPVVAAPVRHNPGVMSEIRHAGPDDVDAVVALVQSAYRGEASRAGWTTEADLLDGARADQAMVDALLADPASSVLVLDGPDGGLLACCHIEHRGDATYLGMFAVRPGAQGQGIGARMMAAAQARAVQAGSPRMEITVLNHRPELVAWYERRGFVRTGQDVPFPYDDERYGIPRRPDLVLQVMIKELDAVR